VGMFGYWTYISGHLVTLAWFIDERFKREMFIPYHPLLEAITHHMAGVPLVELIFGNVGLLFFLPLSLIGCFYMVSKKFGSIYTFAVAACGMIVLGMGTYPSLAGYTVLEFRWNIVTMIMLAIPLSVALLVLCQILKKKFTKAILISVIVFFLAFSMTISPMTNIMDDPAIFPNTGFGFAFTESELRAMDMILDVWDGGIGADHICGVYFTLRHDTRFVRICESLYNRDFTEHHHVLIMVRENIVKHPFFIGPGIIKLDHDPRLLLVEQGFSRIYDNGEVSAFLKFEHSSS